MKYNEFIRLLKSKGWFEVRQSVSHVIMQHPESEVQLTVPNHGSKGIG